MIVHSKSMIQQTRQQLELGPNCGSCEVRAHCVGVQAAAIDPIARHATGDVTSVQAGLNNCEGGQVVERPTYVTSDYSASVIMTEVITRVVDTPAFPQTSFLGRAYEAVKEHVTGRPMKPEFRQ